MTKNRIEVSGLLTTTTYPKAMKCGTSSDGIYIPNPRYSKQIVYYINTLLWVKYPSSMSSYSRKMIPRKKIIWLKRLTDTTYPVAMTCGINSSEKMYFQIQNYPTEKFSKPRMISTDC